MRAGKLDRRVVIQRATSVANGLNEPQEMWGDLATVWAEKKPTRGQERLDAQQVAGAASATFVIRWRSDLKVTDRLLFEGRPWNIKDIREVGRRVGLEIDAVARAE